MSKDSVLIVEEIYNSRPDGVLAAINKWYESIPSEEKNKPIIGNGSEVLTPCQLYEEMKGPLKLQFTSSQRSEKAANMSSISKDMVREIVKYYTDKK